jgi:hypothetical protein
MLKRFVAVGVVAMMVAVGGVARAADEKGGMVVDKEKRTVTIPAKIAPRKINDPRYTEIYPIEAIATAPFPKGQKAHETVVTVDVAPSEVHKALESLGLKAGKPAEGEEGHAEGPEVKVSLVLPSGKTIPMEKSLIDKKTGKAMGTVKWIFTGSAMRQPDPNKPDKVYGADIASNLIMFFPMTPDSVIQTALTVKESNLIKLETNKTVLPPEGTEVKLVIKPAK